MVLMIARCVTFCAAHTDYLLPSSLYGMMFLHCTDCDVTSCECSPAASYFLDRIMHNSCPDLIHFSDIFRAWALCRYLSKFIMIGYSFSYSMFCMMVCNTFIFFCFQMQQQELAQMRQRDANLTALAAIGPRKKRKVNSPGATTTGSEVRTAPPNHMHF